ncbi:MULTISPECIES: ESPR-type extended signal peptide-containing protein [Pasteurellaceae]|uniref:ESPR-type extended signal peptide-containing protein n=1 Tax=Pasteurellaceae TaxID=712 RepID=UPI0035657F4C
MNKIFKVIWNHATQTWVAVSELDKAKGKTKSSSGRKKGVAVLALSVAAAGGCLIGGAALAATATNIDGDITSSTDVDMEVAIGKGSKVVNTSTVTTSDSEGGTTAGGMAIGYNATTVGSGVSIGLDAFAGSDSLAFGAGATANSKSKGNGLVASSTAIGNGAYSEGDYALAVGAFSRAGAKSSIAEGVLAATSKAGSIAIGRSSGASTTQGTRTLGNGVGIPTVTVNQSEGHGSVSLGTYSHAYGDLGVAIGQSSSVSNTSALSVALGAKSVAGAFNNEQSSTNVTFLNASGVNETKEYAGTYKAVTIPTTGSDTIMTASKANGTSVLAIGTNGSERQIQYVAAGRVTNDSTDAINGSQLYHVLNYMGFNVHNTSDSSVARINNNSHIQFKDGNLTEVVAEAKDSGANATVTVNVKQGSFDTTNNGTIAANSTQTGVATVADVAAAVKNTGWYATSNKTGTGTNTGSSKELVNPGETVTFIAGDNINITQSGSNFTISSTATSGNAGDGVHYYSVNDNSTQKDNYKNDGATANNALAAGVAAKASAENATAIGINSNASGIGSVSIGNESKAAGLRTVAIGESTNATMNDDIAVGYGAKTNANNSANTSSQGGALAFGIHTNADGDNAVAVGNKANATGNSAIALAGNSTGTGAVNVGWRQETAR